MWGPQSSQFWGYVDYKEIHRNANELNRDLHKTVEAMERHAN